MGWFSNLFKRKKKKKRAVNHEQMLLEYKTLYDTMIYDKKYVAYVLSRCISHKDKYDKVYNATKIPSSLICGLHSLECSNRFGCNLANGEPLNRVTKLVPKGLGPYSCWEDSAFDALARKKYITEKLGKFLALGKTESKYPLLLTTDDWEPEEMLLFGAYFNGLGYHYRNVVNPYLFSKSQHYVKGKFVSDGKYSSSAVSKQVGLAIIIKELRSLGWN